MNNYKVKEEKKTAAKSHKSKKKVLVYKTFESKVKGLEEVVLKSEAVKHAAQFMKMLEEIVKYVQVKYNSGIARMIKDEECLEFIIAECPVTWVETNIDGMLM